MQAMENMCIGIGWQDAFGIYWSSLELEGWGWRGVADQAVRSQIMKGLVLSAKKWELLLNIYRELLKGYKHEADMIIKMF